MYSNNFKNYTFKIYSKSKFKKFFPALTIIPRNDIKIATARNYSYENILDYNPLIHSFIFEDDNGYSYNSNLLEIVELIEEKLKIEIPKKIINKYEDLFIMYKMTDFKENILKENIFYKY